LRDEGDHLAVFTDVEFGDVAAIAEDLAFLDFVETGQARSAPYHVNVGGKRTYRSNKDTMLVLPQPDEPTRAANLPFSIYSIIRRVHFLGL
jgi:hypothetical protein